jgi:acetyltransferase-like isoleucine patch superfamily enzyme
MRIGKFNDIAEDFKHGNNISIGSSNVILDDVIVGDDVDIQHHTLIKSGTRIGNKCYVDSYVLFSGTCVIGNNVFLRYRTVIARNVIVEDDVFFTAGVKTIYLDHSANATPKPLIIKRGNYFGDNSIIMGGITIAENCVIGANAFVNKSTEPMGVYVGTPAKRIRDLREDELWWRK